ncbi:cob(I)yrinic acid a,c-diamide adenosyltransferase [bacterium]|nr:cob(I)yrinic acid a,c-diamide adenosyltransferase [bacterium]NUN44495.1 cob(I)yrinic acid a,c-diamide adenosyltransferase [bacterium]
MKIYTKTGDDGTTGLFGAGRVQKDATRIESYGTVDELNSVMGLVRCHSEDDELDTVYAAIQNELFILGADLATPMDVKSEYIVRIKAENTLQIEKRIDSFDARLPELTNFILPGGTRASSYLHLARNVCRRTERLTVKLSKEETINEHVLTYLNRLSDLLFVLARWENAKAGIADTVWKKPVDE